MMGGGTHCTDGEGFLLFLRKKARKGIDSGGRRSFCARARERERERRAEEKEEKDGVEEGLCILAHDTPPDSRQEGCCWLFAAKFIPPETGIFAFF